MAEWGKGSNGQRESGARAYVTLAFADLCDYTALSESLDPEEVDAICRQLNELADTVVTKHGGHVAQAYGDGHLCLFGFPDPREDDVRRAIDAALELHEAVRSAQWSNLPAGFEARLHTGVHSGLVFIRKGTELHGRFQLSGDAVNTTSRLCSSASSDEIIVSASSLRGSEQYFETTRVPALWLRGKSGPLDAFRITGRSTVRNRFEASTRRGLTQFVNRQAELGALMKNLESGRAGRGRMLLVTGAAGIGKTRLLQEFSARASRTGVRVLRGTCESYGELVPLEPWSQMLRQVFGPATATANADTDSWIQTQCSPLGEAVSSHHSTYAMLMALQPAHSQALAITNVTQALSVLIDTLAAREPLTLILDDWQWADGASRAVLAQLRGVALARGVCMVVAMRASALADPTLQPDESIYAAPLTEPDCERLIGTLRPESLGFAVSRIILSRAGGNPLFLEELCRALPQSTLAQESSLDRLEVPTTVQGVIQSRVATLPREERELLRTASVIGIEFSSTLLAELCDLSAVDAQQHLDALIEQDLVYRADAIATYRFKHGLTREVVYESVLIAERKLLHGRIAASIEHWAPKESMQTAEALAYHYRGSGDLARAAHYAELAGDRAMAVSALDRACQQYLAAMTALDAIPPSPEIRRKWLQISAKWGLPFVFSPVQSDTQLGVLHTAAKYATELGELLTKARAWHWLGWAHYGLGNYPESIQHYQAALDLAEEIGETRLVAQTQAGLGQSLAASGKYDAALPYLTRALARKREQAQSLAPRRGSVAQGYAYALAATALVHADRGEFTVADEVFAEAFAIVGEGGHAIEGSMLALKCIALLWRGCWEEARECSQRATQNAQRVSSAFNFVTCSCYGAYAAWEATRAYEHIERMRLTIDWIEAQHLELYASADYGWCAHALQCYGEPELARTYVDRARRRAGEGDPMGEAAAYRVLARLPVIGADHASHVDRCLEQATRAGEARGSLHEAVKTQLLRAELSVERGDREAARNSAEASLATARQIGMPWHIERAEILIASLLIGEK